MSQVITPASASLVHGVVAVSLSDHYRFGSALGFGFGFGSSFVLYQRCLAGTPAQVFSKLGLLFPLVSSLAILESWRHLNCCAARKRYKIALFLCLTYALTWKAATFRNTQFCYAKYRTDMFHISWE